MGCLCPCLAKEETNQSIYKSNLGLNPHLMSSSSSPTKIIQSENGEALKEKGIIIAIKGNQYFKKKQFSLAVEAYTKALQLPNPDITYYTNLALALKANRQYKDSIQVINKMLILNFRNSKQAEYIRKGQIIKSRCIIIICKEYCLSAAYSLEETQKRLQQVIIAVNKLVQYQRQPNPPAQLQSYIESGTKVKIFLENKVAPQSRNQSITIYLRDRLNQMQLRGNIIDFYSSCSQILNEVQQTVKSEMQTALQQPQDFILDPITYDIYDNPVLVPSGQSYNENILKQHFKNNGYNDPITHQKYQLGEKVVVRNNNLKAYITQMKTGINKADLDLLKY